MSKFQEIINGYKNLIWEKPEIEKLAMDRAVICSECPENKNNVCNICKCPLISKTRSEYSRCPKNLW